MNAHNRGIVVMETTAGGGSGSTILDPFSSKLVDRTSTTLKEFEGAIRGMVVQMAEVIKMEEMDSPVLEQPAAKAMDEVVKKGKELQDIVSAVKAGLEQDEEVDLALQVAALEKEVEEKRSLVAEASAFAEKWVQSIETVQEKQAEAVFGSYEEAAQDEQEVEKQRSETFRSEVQQRLQAFSQQVGSKQQH
mmetsp:Transcript_7352/g.19072  ORF Transcript_7352/g.19072 Transcript_7352/m.19072 type:complete len:191 (-) Transcript_7352:227-799(-)